MEEKVLLDKDTLKALVVDTRLDILKLLATKKYILSDIASILNLKNSTVKEHLDILVNANLIKKENTERKWKYYSLTFKGKKIVDPQEVKVLFAFIASFLAALGVGITYLWKFLGNNTMFSSAITDVPMRSLDNIMILEAETASLAGNIEKSSEAITYVNAETILLIITIVLLCVSFFLLGKYLKKKKILIIKKN